ncbi:hypothetical protein AVEN_90795-1 [Araneus ventricosus]|uniref:Uncharacterized protein n=1 Tax=Araneus ventricosus TaxID=182803 RepID=A0A4Y2UBR1_ARAVE|nr:hypothetical protein AVEN_90795-1 [Araneus ventricosus]
MWANKLTHALEEDQACAEKDNSRAETAEKASSCPDGATTCCCTARVRSSASITGGSSLDSMVSQEFDPDLAVIALTAQEK